MTTQAEIENLYPSLKSFDAATQTLLGEFHQSKEADQLTRSLIEVALAGVNLWGIESIIAGKYCEGVAGLYVQSQEQGGNRFILSPSETDWLYQQFHSGRHIYSLYDLRKMIVGITIPDGLIFQQGRRYLQLTGVCEYTAQPQNNVARNARKQVQSEQYQKPVAIAKDLGMYEADCINNAPEYGRRLRKLLSHIRPDIPHLPISLANLNSWEIIYALPATSDEDKGHLPYLPFNSTEFRRYIIQLIYSLTRKYQSEYQLRERQTHTVSLSTSKLAALWPETIMPQEDQELYRQILALV